MLVRSLYAFGNFAYMFLETGCFGLWLLGLFLPPFFLCPISKTTLLNVEFHFPLLAPVVCVCVEGNE